VFNPVSFYYCYDQAGLLRCTVAEVNNTFNERHLYLLPAATPLDPTRPAFFDTPKAFHVSPFNDLQGEYAFQFSPPGDELTIDVNIVRESRVVFRSRLEGRLIAFTYVNLRRTPPAGRTATRSGSEGEHTRSWFLPEGGAC
jgi:cyclopropane-fatty-acyl-phospholipid synthase